MSNLYIPTSKYVYFDNDGNLLSISNTNTSKGNYIEVDNNEVENLIKGKEQFSQYYVIFDTLEKDFVLKHRFNEEDVVFDVNNQIYKIFRADGLRSDLTLYQNIKEKKWSFLLDEAIRENFKIKNTFIEKPMYFSVTDFNNPSVLYRIIKITVKELIENTLLDIPFETDLELDPTSVSVYTIKRFESYHHEVINE